MSWFPLDQAPPRSTAQALAASLTPRPRKVRTSDEAALPVSNEPPRQKDQRESNTMYVNPETDYRMASDIEIVCTTCHRDNFRDDGSCVHCDPDGCPNADEGGCWESQPNKCPFCAAFFAKGGARRS